MCSSPLVNGMDVYNLLQHIPVDMMQEESQELVAVPGVRIERIVSCGQSSPPGFWYDQEENEWVMLLQGAARITFEAENNEVALVTGDSVTIPAHARHRVDWTDPAQTTIWLAVFYGG